MTDYQNLLIKEQTKQVMDKYGVAWFKFDEASGNVTDSKGTFLGTIYNAPTRVTGWNGEGSAMNFNGTNQYVSFNGKVIPIGEKSIRFKIKIPTKSTLGYSVLSSSHASNTHGDSVTIRSNGIIGWQSNRNISGSSRFYVESNFDICDNKWHDILLTWDGTTNVGAVKIYVDDLITPKSVGEAISVETLSPTNNLAIGRTSGGTDYYYFKGQLDNLEIYNKALTPEDFTLNKPLILSTNEYKTFDVAQGWQTVSSTAPTVELFVQHGIDDISTLNRKVQNTTKMGMIKDSTFSGTGKVFSKSLDLNKYMDIRSIKAVKK